MGGISVWQLLIILVVLVVCVLPWVLALVSKKVSGGRKFIWFLLSFLFSWLGYFAYYFAVVRGISAKENEFVPHSDNPGRQAPY